MKRYRARVSDRSWVVERKTSPDRMVLAVEGVEEAFTVLPGHDQGPPTRLRVLWGVRPFLVELREADPSGPTTVTVNGQTFSVKVEEEHQHGVPEWSKAGGSAEAVAQVRAPMPGLIVAVEVSPGQPVKVGEGLVIMEAMKMENEIRTPRPGRVREVLVRAGETVEKDRVLVVLE